MNMIQQNVTTVVLKVISYKFLNKVIIYQCNSIGAQCAPEVLKYFYRTYKYQKKSVLDSRPMVKALEGIKFIFMDKIIYYYIYYYMLLLYILYMLYIIYIIYIT